MMFVMARG